MKYFFITRGIKHNIDRFITELQGQYMPYKTDKDKFALQMNVQPVQLWCVGFPKEQLGKVLATIKPNIYHRGFRFFAGALRKMLGLKKIPEVKSEVPFPIFQPGMELIGIGLKEDETFKEGQLKGGEAI